MPKATKCPRKQNAQGDKMPKINYAQGNKMPKTLCPKHITPKTI